MFDSVLLKLTHLSQRYQKVRLDFPAVAAVNQAEIQVKLSDFSKINCDRNCKSAVALR